MNVLVIGYKGLLGFDVRQVLEEKGETLMLIDKDDIDISEEKDITSFIYTHKPDIIINLAAYSDIDKAEEDKEACFAVNTKGAEYVAKAAEQIGAKLVYLSSDYVFDGTKEGSYEITDPYSPKSVYGSSKAEGEVLTKKYCSRAFIIRTGWLYGLGQKTFIDRIIEAAKNNEALKAADDQFGSPTFSYDLALFMSELIKTEKYGTYHVSNEGFISWYDFAVMALEKVGLSNLIAKTHSEGLNFKAYRPHNCRLSKKDLASRGFSRLSSIEEALNRYLILRGYLN